MEPSPTLRIENFPKTFWSWTLQSSCSQHPSWASTPRLWRPSCSPRAAVIRLVKTPAFEEHGPSGPDQALQLPRATLWTCPLDLGGHGLKKFKGVTAIWTLVLIRRHQSDSEGTPEETATTAGRRTMSPWTQPIWRRLMMRPSATSSLGSCTTAW